MEYTSFKSILIDSRIDNYIKTVYSLKKTSKLYPYHLFVPHCNMHIQERS